MMSPWVHAKLQTSDIFHFNSSLCKQCPQFNTKMTKWQVGGMAGGDICMASNRILIFTCNLRTISFLKKQVL